MKKLVLSLILLVVAGRTVAVPIAFTTSEYTADVLVGVDAAIASDSRTATIPPDNLFDLPVLASASQAGSGGGDDAVADAVADNVLGDLFLATSVEAGSEANAGVSTDAAATAGFSGVFSGAGNYSFTLDFQSRTERLLPGINEASATLFLLIDAGSTFIDTSFMLQDLFTVDFTLADGVDGFLNLQLIGDAFANSGRISNVASVDFSLDVFPVNVPEPSTLALLVIAGLMLNRYRTKRDISLDVVAAPVPLPPTFALMVVGLTMLFARGAKRRTDVRSISEPGRRPHV